jgi:hypothetical protein
VNAATDDINERQFLISQIKEPDRLFMRLFGKNIIKSEKIANFLKKIDGHIHNFEWLLDIRQINNLVEKFIFILKRTISKIYNDHIEFHKSADEYFKYLRFYEKTQNLYGHDALYTNMINLQKKDIAMNDDDSDERKRIAGMLATITKKYNECISNKFKDVDEFVNDRLFPTLKINNSITEIDRNIIKIIDKNLSVHKNLYVFELQNLIKSFDNLFSGVNVGRLSSEFHKFDIKSKTLIRDVFFEVLSIEFPKSKYNSNIYFLINNIKMQY